MTHSKEPWRAMGKWIDSCVDGDLFQEVAKCMKVKHGDGDANARRIVAAVNACAGLDTEYLETVGLPEFAGKQLCADKIQQELDAVTAQRDQLREALEAIVSSADASQAAINIPLLQAARAALAATEDKQ